MEHTYPVLFTQQIRLQRVRKKHGAHKSCTLHTVNQAAVIKLKCHANQMTQQKESKFRQELYGDTASKSKTETNDTDHLTPF